MKGNPMTLALRLAAAAILLAVLLVPACRSSGADKGADARASAPVAERGGARLWEENCGRCHNYRRPRERTDAEWSLVLHHMRVRANLTAVEHGEILRFLQDAN